MIAVRENLDSGTTVPRGSWKRRLLASAAAALGYMLMTALPALEATPAAAQTFVVGGFRIHVSGMGGGGGHYYSHHRSSRHHADTGSLRHARRRGGEREEETAAGPAPASQIPPAAPVATSPSVEVPVTSAARPLLHGPDLEPSK